MKLSEFSEGQDLLIMVLFGDQQIDFNSTIEEINPKKHFIYIAPIIKNNKLVTFNAKGVHVNLLIHLPDSKPLLFRNIILLPIKRSNDTYCYRIHSNIDGIEFNRRGAFRCPIDLNTVLKIGTGQTTYDIILRDVSATGFSFVFKNENIPCNEGDFVHTILNDFLESTCENFTFQLFGSIVRSVELDNKKIIYGCKLVKKTPNLDTYIAKKERSTIQKNRGTKNRPIKNN